MSQNARDDLGDLAELLMVEGLDAQLASRQRLLVHERLERDRGEVAHRDLRKESRENGGRRAVKHGGKVREEFRE